MTWNVQIKTWSSWTISESPDQDSKMANDFQRIWNDSKLSKSSLRYSGCCDIRFWTSWTSWPELWCPERCARSGSSASTRDRTWESCKVLPIHQGNSTSGFWPKIEGMINRDHVPTELVLTWNKGQRPFAQFSMHTSVSHLISRSPTGVLFVCIQLAITMCFALSYPTTVLGFEFFLKIQRSCDELDNLMQ